MAEVIQIHRLKEEVGTFMSRIVNLERLILISHGGTIKSKDQCMILKLKLSVGLTVGLH